MSSFHDEVAGAEPSITHNVKIPLCGVFLVFHRFVFCQFALMKYALYNVYMKGDSRHVSIINNKKITMLQIELIRGFLPDMPQRKVIDNIAKREYEFTNRNDAEMKQLALACEHEICTECFGAGEVEIQTAPDDSIIRKCICRENDTCGYDEIEHE